LLLTIDRPVRELALRNQSRTGGDLADAGNLYGSFPPWLIASGILYGGGALTRSERTRTTGLMLFESIAISGSITAVCKVLTGRSRPYVNEGAFRFRGVRFSDESLSLPSGHSTVAFAASSVLASRIGNPAAAAGLYLLAGLTAASRVYRDEHWISDTFLGAAIGTVVGNAVVRFGEREAAGAGLLIIPATGGMRAELVF
jgi:membrane-associated phospholipid phosphatase